MAVLASTVPTSQSRAWVKISEVRKPRIGHTHDEDGLRHRQEDHVARVVTHEQKRGLCCKLRHLRLELLVERRFVVEMRAGELSAAQLLGVRQRGPYVVLQRRRSSRGASELPRLRCLQVPRFISALASGEVLPEIGDAEDGMSALLEVRKSCSRREGR